MDSHNKVWFIWESFCPPPDSRPLLSITLTVSHRRNRTCVIILSSQAFREKKPCCHSRMWPVSRFFFSLLFLLFSRSNLLDLSFFVYSKRCSPGTQGHNWRTWGTKQQLKHQWIFTFKWFAWELLNDFIYCRCLLRHFDLAENILWQWFLVTEPPLYNHLHRWRWI